MAARRLILAMLVLLVLSSILAALVPVERGRLSGDSSSTTTDTVTEQPAATGQLVRRTVTIGEGSPERIELALGDQLDLTVKSQATSDLVEISEFGALQNVDPDFPAHFDILALDQGTFPVRLVDKERTVARIVVGPANDQAKGSGKSKDSPGSSTDNSTPGASSLS